MNKYKVIALMGKSGAGKDTLLHEVLIQQPEVFNEIISYTTRPIRENETDGKSYHFISNEKFQDKIDKNEMLEYTNFNNWYYGTSVDSLNKDKVNIGVFNPAGVRSLMKYNDIIELTIYYIKVDDKMRLLRQLNRELHPDVHEIIRRFNTDEKDFSNINDIAYIELSNSDAIEKTLSSYQIMDNLHK